MAETTKALSWDAVGERFYETGVDHGVLYPYTAGTPGIGVAWNGLTAVTQSPDGAEASAQYADNMKYLTLRSAENFKGTIEAFYSPEEFDACDGSVAPTGTVGLKFTQQTRQMFGLCYRTRIGNDEKADDYGYKIHLVYGATASPAERNYQTVNETPEAMTLSWEFETTPISLSGYKPIAHIEIDASKCVTTSEKACLTALETILYGSTNTDPRLPLPSEVITTMTPASAG